MTRFSIVIPTRNRAQLLRSALRSALAQRFEDFEVVVSDNYSADGTRGVVEAMGDRRVRYVRSPRVLSMPDSWEFALMNARGEYLTVLPDDDAISPWLLQKVDSVLATRPTRLLQWTGATYFDNSWPAAGARGMLLVPTFTRRMVELDSPGTLRGLFGLRGDRFPTLANSACHRSVLQGVLRDQGHLFYGYCPDHSGSCVMLCRVDTYLFLDEVLSVGGATSQSIGMTGRYNKGGGYARYLRELGYPEPFRHVPLQIPIVTNLLAETLLRVREALRDQLETYALDWTHYFVLCHFELFSGENVDAEVEKGREEFSRVLAAQPRAFRQAVQGAIEAERSRRVTGPREIDCVQLGITDILDCVRHVDSLPVSLRGAAKGLVLSVFRGRGGLRIARGIGRLGELCGLGSPSRRRGE